MLLSTLYIMGLMHLQSLKLLRPKVEEEIHIQENKFGTLTLRAKITSSVAQYPLHHVTYATAKF